MAFQQGGQGAQPALVNTLDRILEHGGAARMPFGDDLPIGAKSGGHDRGPAFGPYQAAAVAHVAHCQRAMGVAVTKTQEGAGSHRA